MGFARYTGVPQLLALPMSPLVAFILESPLHWLGFALSTFGGAVALEGLCARMRLGPKGRKHSWDVIVFGAGVSTFMLLATLRALGLASFV